MIARAGPLKGRLRSNSEITHMRGSDQGRDIRAILPVQTYWSIGYVIACVNERPRPLALYAFGPDDADRARLLASTTSGDVGINTLLHVA